MKQIPRRIKIRHFIDLTLLIGRFLNRQRRASVFSGLRINRSFSGDPEAAGSYGSRVSVVGNRIQLFAEEEAIAENPVDSRPTLDEAQEMLAYKRTDSSRHLRGNWLAYWEHEAGRADRDTRFNFKQIRLLQLSGHSAGVRCIHGTVPLDTSISN